MVKLFDTEKPKIKRLRKRFSERPGGVIWLKGPNIKDKDSDTCKIKVSNPELEKTIKILDGLLEKSRLPTSLKVFRRETGELEEQILKANIGDFFVDRGFAAVTAYKKNIELETKGYAATVLLQKGMSAVPISTVLKMNGLEDKYPGEGEIMIPRDLIWKIVDKDDDNKNVTFFIPPS